MNTPAAQGPVRLSPDQVADFLLCECRERGEILTNLKLQKLLYYAQAWHLANTGEPLFEEDFQAWVHGPVLPSQFKRFQQYQWQPLTVDVTCPTLPASVVHHLKEVVDVFGSETAVALELMTHREKPWMDARGDLPPTEPSRNPILKDAMRDFYRSLR